MNLTIGLLAHDAAWEELLTQIGASWTPVGASVQTDAYSAVIVNTEPEHAMIGPLRTYLREGGALLGDFGRLHRVLGCGTSRRRYGFLASQDFGRFSPSSIVDIDSTGKILNGCTSMDEGPIQLVSVGRGIAASLPFDVSGLVRSTAFKRRNFYAPKDRLPSEYVSAVSKGALREVVTRVIQELHHARKLPFIHTWYYPEGKPSIFTFRVDTDKGSKNELSELYDVCRRHDVRGSWFADVKSHESWLDFFSGFQQQEIGLHCYEHRTDDTVEAVDANFSKGYALLRDAGFSVRGATAPTGRWNEAVDAVYRKLGICYSSEFSLIYDDLPSHPVIGDAVSPVLQLPVHPVCVGSMRRSAFTSDEMKAYFRAWIGNRLASRNPMCLYHHPTHHHWDVFEDAFTLIGSLGIPSMTYGEYAAWWKKRTARRPVFTYNNGHIVVAQGMDPELWYRISLPGCKEIITPIGGTFDVAHAVGQKEPEPIAHPADITRARAFDPRHWVQNALDRWYTYRS